MQIPLRVRRIKIPTRSDLEPHRRSEGPPSASQPLLTLEPVSTYAPACESIYFGSDRQPQRESPGIDQIDRPSDDFSNRGLRPIQLCRLDSPTDAGPHGAIRLCNQPKDDTP